MTTTVRALGAAIVALLAASVITLATRDTTPSPRAGAPTPTPAVSVTPTVSETPTVQRSPAVPTQTPTTPAVTQQPTPRTGPTQASKDGPRDMLPRTGRGAAQGAGLVIVIAAIGALWLRKPVRAGRAR